MNQSGNDITGKETEGSSELFDLVLSNTHLKMVSDSDDVRNRTSKKAAKE